MSFFLGIPMLLIGLVLFAVSTIVLVAAYGWVGWLLAAVMLVAFVIRAIMALKR